MSGVGEAIAIISCVAGLVEALAAGQRIIKQIKERRQAHRSANGALPPSERLEQTLEEGKKNIEKLCEKGRQRFGDDYEADDIANLAIMQITIQIQNALLNRLTQARSDDGVIDFDECIDLSDQGCNDALVALGALYQRRLKEDIERKQKRESVQQVEEVEEETHATENTNVPSSPGARNVEANTSKPRVPKEAVGPSPPVPVKKSRSVTLNFLQKVMDKPESEGPKPQNNLARYNSSPASVAPQRHGTMHLDRPSTSKSANRYSVGSDSSQSTTATPMTETSESSWTVDMSRASTMKTVSPVLAKSSTLTNCGETCKYALKAREKGCKEGVGQVNLAMAGARWVLKCRSVKCGFQAKAVSQKNKLQLDEEVYKRHGVWYRWSFLVKSHMACDATLSEWPFLCLVCMVLNQESAVYQGADALFVHLSKHSEATIGRKAIALGDQLSFSATDVEISNDFDVRLPVSRPPPSSVEPLHASPPTARPVAQQRDIIPDPEPQAPRRNAARAHEIEEHADLFPNPWAFT